MLKSMTGFGRAEQTVGDKTFQVDIKSLNGKQFELQLKLPAFLKPFEFTIRKLLSDKLGRGSLDCTISLKGTGNAKPVSINTDLAKAYYRALADLSNELNLDPSNILSTLVKLPEVITPTSDTLTDQEWQEFETVILSAIDDLNAHRLNEGASLEEDLTLRIDNILKHQEEVVKLEPLRQQKIREGLKKLLEDNVGKENYDPNRLEQELIYYIEKIDISEEQVRLKNHLRLFQVHPRRTGRRQGQKTILYSPGDRTRDQYDRFKSIRFHHPAVRGVDEGRARKSKRTGFECVIVFLYKRVFLKNILLLVAAAGCLCWISCSIPSGVFEKNVVVPGQQWASSFKPTINFEISPRDTAGLYNVYIVLRHTDAYNYNNIWIRGTVKTPGDTVGRSERYDLSLADNEKGWKGSGMDDIFENRIWIQQQTRFNRPGTYSYTLEQIMWDDPLKNVLNVGIRIEKVP
ncbi:gliding motility lipoprotein GldH [Puia sp. P3]|uniref:gliding motility lipoprotein GldH n=1 Tax=Puia sp. P3 TaxID=3423952 RepID=UPI003D66660C